MFHDTERHPVHQNQWSRSGTLRYALCVQDGALQEELTSLRLRLSEQDQALKDAVDRVKSSNRTKDDLETFIVGQRESPMLTSI